MSTATQKLSRAGIEVTVDSDVTADELPSSCKTLILAEGGSSKGLGAAGIDTDGELARTGALLQKAEEQGVTIVAMHTGGSARRVLTWIRLQIALRY